MKEKGSLSSNKSRYSFDHINNIKQRKDNEEIKIIDYLNVENNTFSPKLLNNSYSSDNVILLKQISIIILKIF